MATPETVQLRAKVHRNLKFLEIDGETYVRDSDKLIKKGKTRNEREIALIFRKYDAKKYEKIVDSLAEKISKKTNVKEIIKQALFSVPLQDIIEIGEELKKKKPSIRNNKGCFSMSVGKVKIPIRD